MSTAKEDTVENYLVRRATERGGLAIKLNPKGYKGIPDRLVVLPGRILFMELKRPKGGAVAELQLFWAKLLGRLGCEVWLCKNKEEVDRVLDARPPRV